MKPSDTRDIIRKWTTSLSKRDKIIQLFEKVRDIPYGDVGSREPLDVYKLNKGTCSGKHELLKSLYQELGIDVKDYVAMHKFNDLPIDFPKQIRGILARTEITDFHNFFKIRVNEKWATVDATWDKELKKFGFVVNESWDGKCDMKIAVTPLEVLEVKCPIQFKKEKVNKLPLSIQNERKLFLQELSRWLDTVRKA